MMKPRDKAAKEKESSTLTLTKELLQKLQQGAGERYISHLNQATLHKEEALKAQGEALAYQRLLAAEDERAASQEKKE